MNVKTIIYYRYLMRQTILMFVFSIFIAIAISSVFLFTNIFERKLSIIISSLIWLLPLYNLFFLITWFFKFTTSKKQLTQIDLYKRLTNANIRKCVLRSGISLKYFFPKKNQENLFFNAIDPEIRKQKELLSILTKTN